MATTGAKAAGGIVLLGLAALLALSLRPRPRELGHGPLHRVLIEPPLIEPAIPRGDRVAIAWLPRSVARHTALFVHASRAHRVDAELLAIVTLVESGGWTAARSPSGARGLMQVMPATGAVIAGERGVTGHATAKLLDPDYAVDFGAWYLARQLEDFATADVDDTVGRAAAAYNGGPTLLRRHLDEGVALPRQTARYRTWVGGMWAERRQARSATFDAWREAGGGRLLARAEAELATQKPVYPAAAP